MQSESQLQDVFRFLGGIPFFHPGQSMTLFWKSHGLCFESAIFSETPKKCFHHPLSLGESRNLLMVERVGKGGLVEEWNSRRDPPYQAGEIMGFMHQEGTFFLSVRMGRYNSNWLLMAKPWIHGQFMELWPNSTSYFTPFFQGMHVFWTWAPFFSERDALSPHVWMDEVKINIKSSK